MAEIHHPDAGHSGPSSEASTDTIEMTPLEDHLLEHRHHKDEDYQDEYRYPEEGSDDEDDVDRALLFPEDRTRGRERSHSPTPETGTWGKVIRITVEVCPIVHLFCILQGIALHNLA